MCSNSKFTALGLSGVHGISLRPVVSGLRRTLHCSRFERPSFSRQMSKKSSSRATSQKDRQSKAIHPNLLTTTTAMTIMSTILIMTNYHKYSKNDTNNNHNNEHIHEMLGFVPYGSVRVESWISETATLLLALLDQSRFRVSYHDTSLF